MGTAVSVCRNVLDVALKEEGELSAALASQYGPQLLPRVDAAPIRDGPAVFPNPFRLTDEIILEGVEGLAAYGPFMSRFNLARRAESGSKFPFTWPDTDRVCMPHVFMRARIEGTGRYVLLQICASVADQKLHRVLAALQDCKEVVQYAANFNKFIAETAQDVGGFESPQVKVCAPVGCRVLDSKIPQLTGRDSHILVFDYPSAEVTKFILDGTEEFHELSQAFFHHVAWATNGNAMLFDLKGADPGSGDILLVDPCILRTDGEQAVKDSVKETAFEVLHRNCGQLCKAFDPSRRSGKVRRMCGVPACGLSHAGR